jgi:subtilisin family serine protease
MMSALGVVVTLTAPSAIAAPLSIQGANEVLEAAERKPTVRVMVQIGAGESPSLDGSIGQQALGAVSAVNRIDAAKLRVTSLLTSLRARLVKPLPGLPVVVVEVDREMLDRLLASSDVVAVQEDVPEKPLLPQSGPLVHAPQAWALNARGAGTAVAVLDSGVQADHPFLAGRVVAEACFSSTSASSGSTTVCRNNTDEQVGAGAAAPCSLSGCDHGTHVAGIASGRGATFSGMAPDSRIVAVQVFSRFTDQGAITPCRDAQTASPCILSFRSDQLRGLGYVRNIAGIQNIAAVNMSIGGGDPTGPCLTDMRRPLIQLLRGLGVATAIASGNDGSSTGVSIPACIPEAITVGSTTKTDAVSGFSNSSPMVDLLAPGSDINSSVPATGFDFMDGTSMATPHVAGAIADLASLPERWTVDQLENALRSSGTPVTDARNNLTVPRIDISGAIQCLRRPTARSPMLGLYRPGTGTIWILSKDSSGAFAPTYNQGDPGNGIGGYDLRSGADRAFMFDYEGSGKLDHLVLYRPGTGTLWILKGTCGQFAPVYRQGDPGQGIGGYDLRSPRDEAFAFDYDSSGRMDHLALYRPGTGTFWILRKSPSGVFAPVYQQGDPGNGIGGYDLRSPADRAFAFDYNSSGRMDHIVLYRPGTGTIWILRKGATGDFNPVYNQGDPGNGIGGYDLRSPADQALAFDYDSSGKMDHLVLYRPGTGTIWILKKSATGSFSPVYNQGDPGTGIAGYDLRSPADRVVAVDYDGTGKRDDLALYRPGTGTIWILKKNPAGTFTAVYRQGDPGTGIGGYDLRSAADRLIAIGPWQ